MDNIETRIKKVKRRGDIIDEETTPIKNRKIVSLSDEPEMNTDEGETTNYETEPTLQEVISTPEGRNIKTTALLDAESKSGYWLTVFAQDQGIVPLHSKLEVYVSVENINDNVPLTVQPIYIGRVTENSAANTTVLHIIARDADVDQLHNFTYSITAGNTDGLFTIDPKTGVLSTSGNNTIDREIQMEHEIQVTVTDNGFPSLSSTTAVIISVEDVNDNAPVFEHSLYHFVVMETRPGHAALNQNELDSAMFKSSLDSIAHVNKSWEDFDSELQFKEPLLRVVAADKDIGKNGEIHYSLTSGENWKKFHIHPQNGYIYVVNPLLSGDEYILNVSSNVIRIKFHQKVQAVDNGEPSQSSTTRVSIKVVPAMNNSKHAPSVRLKNHIVKISEDELIGFFVAQIEATDEDSKDFLWFKITDGDPHSVFMVAENGRVLLAKQLDRETQKQYDLTVTVTDGVHNAFTKLTIIVIDTNEHRPQFSQPFYLVNVTENIALGTELVQIKATDTDHDNEVQYSIHCVQNLLTLSAFKMDANSGSLIVTQPLDRESIAEHVITVMVKDNGSPSKSNFTRVIIYVEDTNDHTPQWNDRIVQSRVLETAEIGTAVLTLLASDRDHGVNALLTYTIVSGNIGNTFAVDPQLGVLYLTKELDSRKIEHYAITVKAADEGKPSLSSTVRVHVTVVTPDNSPPRFAEKQMFVELFENIPPRTQVTHIEATSTSSLNFEIISGDNENAFLINPNNGILMTKRELDYERIKIYNLTVTATNMVGMKAQCQLMVHILDCNDNSPYFVKTNYWGTVVENTAVGSVVLMANSSILEPLVMSAKDNDSQVNALLQFEIVEPFARNSFYIDAFTGTVRTAAKLDYETTTSLEFRVIAVDLGKPQQTSNVAAVIHIYIVDVNDCPPVFVHNVYNVSVLFPTYDYIRIIQVEAIDYDSIEMTTLRYSVLPAQGALDNVYEIDASSGVVRIINSKKISHDTVHHLKVIVSDGKHTSEASVLITWTLNTDSGLQFQHPLYYGEVQENSTKLLSITVVSVTGSHLNEHIIFSILNPSSEFEIGPTSGVITTTGIPLDREAVDHYLLIVQAQSKDFEDKMRVAQTTVNITVLDANDNCPVFLNQPYFAVISDTAQRSDVITKVQAVDMDSAENGDIRYELSRGHSELFQVGKKTGEISLKQKLDMTKRKYKLTITAIDGGSPSCATDITVNLKSVDHTMPMFEKQFYEIIIAENFPVYTPLPVIINAYSAYGSPVVYSITGGDQDQQFATNFTTGSRTNINNNNPCTLYITEKLDYEAKQDYLLSLRATDSISKIFSEIQINIVVTDINDCAPEFNADYYNITIAENTPVGAFLLQVTATDNDTGVNSIIYYTLEGENINKHFSIDTDDGKIYLQHAVDYEMQKLHVLNVIATDKGIPEQCAVVLIWLHVQNVNDNPPQFSQTSYSCWLSEEVNRGHLVSVIAAYDADFDQLHYTIVSENEHHTFSIHQNTGALSVANLYYLHQEESHSIQVLVIDGLHTTSTRVYIEMISANKNSPQLQQHVYDARISENMPSGTPVTTVVAVDKDSGIYGRISYSIPSQMLLQTFHINSLTGEIWTKKKLDREKQTVYELPVLATDGGGRLDWATVHLSVTDDNDNTPVFQLPEYTTTIYANLSVNYVFLKLTAEDKDDGEASKIIYSILEPATSTIKTLFAINPHSGGLYLVRSALSYENKMFQFFVRANDCGTPSLHTDITVSIHVANTNKVLPIILRRDDTFIVPEHAQTGTIVAKVTMISSMAVDYKLLETTSTFSISPGGEIRLLRNIDRETISSYTVGVLASTRTNPPLATLAEFVIRVKDINDNVPRFHCDNYTIALVENIQEATSVFKVHAEDPDKGGYGEVHYSLTEDETPFMVDQHSGWIMTSKSLDKETASSFTLTIVAADNGTPSLSSTSLLRINIIDYNDNLPVFAQDTYTAEVKEDAPVETVIIHLSMTDHDVDVKPNVAYYVTDGDLYSQFAVLPTGHVYIAHTLDREIQEQYSLTIAATDGKFVALVQLHITVLDVNDEKPTCQQSKCKQTISESLLPGSYVCNIQATDKDVQPKHKYDITGEGHQHFYIDEITGELRAGDGLDREKLEHYMLTVHVQDIGFPEQECVSYVDISLSDINDSPPAFYTDKYIVDIYENAPVGTPIIKVQAVDNDTGTNRRVLYSLIDPADDHLSIEADTGVIYLVKPLDRESKENHILTLKAVDQGIPQLSSLVSIQVIILDVNDNPPEFVQHFYNATIFENATHGSAVITVLANSLDTGLNAQITYSIIAGNDDARFLIDSKTGRISVFKELDYEDRRSYLLTAMATDMGVPPLSNQVLVSVTVLDCNDNAPVFTELTYITHVSEDAQIGTIVSEVTAVDVDSEDNNRLQYSLVSGDKHQQFFVDSETGQIYTAKSLDRETIPHYELKIKAMDSGYPQMSSLTTVIINIQDINDNPPQFSQSNFTAVVKENKPAGWPVCQVSVTDMDASPNAAPFIYKVLYDDSGGMFTLRSNGTLKTAVELSSKLRGTYFIHVRVYDSGTPSLHSETWIIVKVVEESKYPPVTIPLNIQVIVYQDHWVGSELGQVTATDRDLYDSFEYKMVPPTPEGLFTVHYKSGILCAVTGLDTGQYIVNVSVTDGKFTSYARVSVAVQSIWDDVLKHSISIRLPKISPNQFLTSKANNLTKFLESVLLRNITILSFQSSGNGDLDVLLAFSGEVELPVLSDILQSGGYGNMTIPCECQNDATCRQQVNFQSDTMTLFSTNQTSFVSPSFRHQLYCSCNSGFTGEQCEEVLASVECLCPTSHTCIPQTEPPGYKCQLITHLCSTTNQTCNTMVTSNMYVFTWDEIIGICVAVIAIASFVGIFMLYRRYQNTSKIREHPTSKQHFSEDTAEDQKLNKTCKLNISQVPSSFTVSGNESYTVVATVGGDSFQNYSSLCNNKDNTAVSPNRNYNDANSCMPNVITETYEKDKGTVLEEKTVITYGFPTNQSDDSDIHRILCTELPS